MLETVLPQHRLLCKVRSSKGETFKNTGHVREVRKPLVNSKLPPSDQMLPLKVSYGGSKLVKRYASHSSIRPPSSIAACMDHSVFPSTADVWVVPRFITSIRRPDSPFTCTRTHKRPLWVYHVPPKERSLPLWSAAEITAVRPDSATEGQLRRV